MLQIGQELKIPRDYSDLEIYENTRVGDVLLLIQYTINGDINRYISRIVQRYEGSEDFFGTSFACMQKYNYIEDTVWNINALILAPKIIYLGNVKCNLWKEISPYA